MALKLGELVAILRADDRQMEQGLDQAESKFAQFGQRLQGAATAVGAAAALAIGVGLAGAMELDAARAKLAAQVGDPVLARQLGEVAGHVYGRGFGESAAEAMDAARAVMASGLLPKGADAAVIEEITVKAQTLATALGADVTQAARAAGQMVRTGLAKDATEAFDILTRTMELTGDQAGDLLDTVTEYSTQFREIGIDGTKAMGLLAQTSQAGARDLDTAADAIKEFAIRSKDGSATSADAFKAIGLNAERMTAIFARGGPEADKAMKLVLDKLKAMKNPVEQDAAAVGLFGTKAEDLQDALYALDPTTAAGALGQVEGASERAGDALEKSASQRLTAFKRRVHEALVEKVGQALPYLEKVGQWAMDNSGLLLTIAGVIGGLAVTVWAVRGAMAAWNAVQLIWTGITKGAAAAQWLLNIAMSANPIGLIILAIVALVAGIVLLWNKSEAFRNFWIAVWDWIKNAALAVGRWFRDTLWPWMKGVWDAISGAAGKAKDWIVDKWNAMIGFFTSLPGKLRAAARGMWDGIKDAFRSAVNWIIRKWNNISFRIPGISVPGIGQVWGGATLSTPDLPYLATGGAITRAGMAMVGERGREAVYLPAGASVQPNRYGAVDQQQGGGHAEVRLTGEFRVRGSDLVLVLRDRVAKGGGSVQAVIGSNT